MITHTKNPLYTVNLNLYRYFFGVRYWPVSSSHVRSARSVDGETFRWRATIEFIVAHEIGRVHQENRFGVQLLTTVLQVEIVFSGQLADVVRLEVRPVFHRVRLIL